MKRFGFLLLGLCLSVGVVSAIGCGEAASDPAPPTDDSGAADDAGEGGGADADAGDEEASE